MTNKKKIIIYLIVSLTLLAGVVFYFALNSNNTNDSGGSNFIKNTVDNISDTISDSGLNNYVKNNMPEKTIKLSDATIMAWVYPDEPACNASVEYSDGRRIDILKVEYFRVEYDGTLSFLDEETTGCNGYSEENVENVKNFSSKQYVTIASASASGMSQFLKEDSDSNVHTDRLVEFVIENNFIGVELDFEDFGNWDEDSYTQYKNFVSRLGNELHKKRKKMMVDGPPIVDEIQNNWYVWDYRDFNELPVDFINIMAYDYQFDEGSGTPVAPLEWIDGVVKWSKDKIKDDSKIVIGLPSYGYRGKKGSHSSEIMTFDQISKLPGFSSAIRDSSSGEMTWSDSNYDYFYQDSESLNQKVGVVLSNGIKNISVWHLGGNNWFTQ